MSRFYAPNSDFCVTQKYRSWLRFYSEFLRKKLAVEVSDCHVYQSYSNDRHGKSFMAIILTVLDACECDLSGGWPEGWGDRVYKNINRVKPTHIQRQAKTFEITCRFENCNLSGFIYHFDALFVTVKGKENDNDIDSDNDKLNRRHGWPRLLHSDKRPSTSCVFTLWRGPGRR